VSRSSLPQHISTVPCALTAKQVAALLNVSHITVFKMAAAGRIPHFRIGSCVRFDPQVIARWLEEQTCG